MTRAARAGSSALGRALTRPGGADLLTPAEVAAMYRCTTKTLANWRYLGIGPAYVKTGRVLYLRADVEDYLDSLRRLA